MDTDDRRRLEQIETELRRNDPRFARGMSTGRPHRPREYRRGPAWLLAAIAVPAWTGGIALGHGLLIAAGLLLGGTALCLLDLSRLNTRDPGNPRP